jgi:cytochrome c556
MRSPPGSHCLLGGAADVFWPVPADLDVSCIGWRGRYFAQIKMLGEQEMRAPGLFCTLAALLALAAAGTSAAPANKQQVLKEREALMKRQGRDLGAVKGYLDGKLDQAQATAAIVDLTRTMREIPTVFPPGTAGPSPDGKFAAKPVIWADWQDFLAHRNTAAAKVDTLVAAVRSGDKARTRTAFADLGKNGCGACHGKFREKLGD